MKKKFLLFLLLFLTFFSFSNIIYAEDNEISNSLDYIDTSVYHTFINYLVSHDGDKYSKYINNLHCTILKVSLTDDYFSRFATYGGYASYLNINSYDEQNKYNQNTSNNSIQYLTYIALFSAKPLVYSEVNNTINFNNHTYHTSENLDIQDNGDLYFIMGMTNTLNITIYPFNYNNTFNPHGFNFNSGTHLVYTDDTIYYKNSALQYAQPSNSNIELFDFEIIENETSISLYQKVMALYNNEFNTYARLWSSGDKPTIAIFDNSNTNCIIPLLDSSNFVANKYIAVFSTCRLCEYPLNNNSRHFNSLTYGDEVLHILTFDEGTNNYNFYNLMSRNYQNDVIILNGIFGDELLFCNSNIVQKSNANNFVVSSNNQLTYYYYSDLELIETYPINNNNNNNNDTSSVWHDIEEAIQNNSVTFSDTIIDIYNATSEDIANSFMPFLNQIAHFFPISILNDFISFLRLTFDDALIFKNNILSNNGYVFTFNFLNCNFSFNPFYYFFTTNMYNVAYLLCNFSFFSFVIFSIYKQMVSILSKV